MVFSSKAFSLYTQLFLTHFDQAGNSSPPVLLAHFTETGRAANIPEFVHAEPGAIRQISEQFVNDYNYVRQSKTNIQFEDVVGAEAACGKALALNPKNAEALCNLGTLLGLKGQQAEALQHYHAALDSDPNLFEAHFALGTQLAEDRRAGAEVIDHLEAAVRIRPQHAAARYHLGLALQGQGELQLALAQFSRILALDPHSAPALAQAAFIRATCPQRDLRDYHAAVQMAEQACKLTNYNDPEFLATLGRVYAEVGRRPEAIAMSQRAVAVARRSGRDDFARRVERDFQAYWRQSN
jgi:tetratricopeptide (TPR) repeat protein